ncbi:MAG TPA: hypothetical protein VF254_00670 [Gammaproteobacteria bacterium]
MQTSHSLPPDFEPWKALAALKGIAMAIEWFVTEGPGAEQPMPRDAEIALHGLVHASRLFANQVHAYLEFAHDAGVEFPAVRAADDDEIGEMPASYRMN